MDKRVLIYINATKQTTTAVWKLESIGTTDNWVAILFDIPDLKPFARFSNVSIKFHDRERKAAFYCANDSRLVQKGCCNLDFWVKESNKESEDETMHHNLTITKEENKVIEEYWCIRAVKENYVTNAKSVIGEMKCDKEPTLNEIAAFLDNMQADFVSVEHNYRFADLPFC